MTLNYCYAFNFSIFVLKNIFKMREVVIVSVARTPIGSFMGALSSISAPKLGAIAIEGALKKVNLKPEMIDEVLMGNVVQAGTGQAPARQAAIYAGIPDKVPCTTVNKVCASGLKSVMLGAQTIALGQAEVIVAGGMENMSLIPHYAHLRNGHKFGDVCFIDGLTKDGLTDVYDQQAMGEFADLCADTNLISREDQDTYAIESYTRAKQAWDTNKFTNEVIPVSVPQRRGEDKIVSEDEEFKNVKFDKIPSLRPAFSKTGTVTAANASTINDGASALVLMSEEKAMELGLTPLAVIKSYADAAQEPEWFTMAPSKALPIALDRANLNINEIDFFELNEAFSVVALANQKELNIPSDKLNVYGGAVALGHPLGCSGARILTTLVHTLNQNNAQYGAAAICNGGGGASALIIENTNYNA